MKKFMAICLTLLMLVSLVACGAPATSEVTADGTTSAATDDTAADATGEIPTQTIKLTHPQPENTPEDMAIKEMAAQIEELSGGAITCEVFPNGQIGSIPESIQSVQMGVTQIAMGPCAIIASYAEDIALIDMPYLLPQDTSVISEVMNSEIGVEFMDRLEPAGITGLGFWFAGFRQMTSNSDINSVADMEGLKMRIMESNILTSTYNALGAQPIVIAYAETYNALQNGTVDAQENPAQSTYGMNFHEVQDYIVETYHDSQSHILMVNSEWWNAQDAATQEIVRQAELAGRAVLDAELPEYTQFCIDEMVATGCTYHALTDDQVAEFKEATAVVYDEFLTTEWRQDYIPRLQAAFDEAVAAKAS